MMAKFIGIAATVVLSGLTLVGCETTPRGPTQSDPSITIPYNPYNFDPDELYSEAQAHCDAYGLSAVYVDETIDPSSVRWRYRHFSCVER